MISEPTHPLVPVTTLADRMKIWPMLAAHQLEEIKTVLLAFEERLNALEPKTGKSIFAPGTNPDVKPPLFSKPVPIPVPLAPIPEPSVLPAPSYAQSDTFSGKSIFAPPVAPSPLAAGMPGTPAQTGIIPNPVQPSQLASPGPTIFAPAKP
jgi:hypothetical protein